MGFLQQKDLNQPTKKCSIWLRWLLVYSLLSLLWSLWVSSWPRPSPWSNAAGDHRNQWLQKIRIHLCGYIEIDTNVYLYIYIHIRITYTSTSTFYIYIYIHIFHYLTMRSMCIQMIYIICVRVTYDDIIASIFSNHIGLLGVLSKHCNLIGIGWFVVWGGLNTTDFMHVAMAKCDDDWHGQSAVFALQHEFEMAVRQVKGWRKLVLSESMGCAV